MNLMLFAGSANLPLAESIASHLGVALGRRDLETFPDGELHVVIQDSVRGADVYLLQSTGPPVERHLLEALLLADAARRAGADRITAVMPYFGYARQDRRAGKREAVAARLIAELIHSSGIDRVVAVDLHNPAIEGCFPIPLEHLSAVPILAEAARDVVGEDAVVVAPDLGATRLADQYAARLDLPVAIVHKTRVSGEAVSVRRLTGDVRSRAPLIVDDMITTGGTIEAAMVALLDAGCRPNAIVVATHPLLVGPAVERLRALPLRRLIVTDTLPLGSELPLPIHVATLAPLLADVIARLHEGRSLSEFIARG